MSESPPSPLVTALRRAIARILFVPTLAWNYLLARVLHLRHWWDKIDEHVYMGAFPFPSDVPAMQREGIGAVVNTCEEYGGPVRAYRRAGIEQLRVPTIDFTPPSVASIERAVIFMRQQIAQGRTVYVHCNLIAAQGLTPPQAQQQILDRRPHAHPRLAQRTVVQEFWQKYQQGRDDGGLE